MENTFLKIALSLYAYLAIVLFRILFKIKSLLYTTFIHNNQIEENNSSFEFYFCLEYTNRCIDTLNRVYASSDDEYSSVVNEWLTMLAIEEIRHTEKVLTIKKDFNEKSEKVINFYKLREDELKYLEKDEYMLQKIEEWKQHALDEFSKELEYNLRKEDEFHNEKNSEILLLKS